MSKIRIKNFGPIKDGFDTEDGFMDIKKVTVFIGDQGTGKSTVAKLISMFSWLEKAINRGDIAEGPFDIDFIKGLAEYQLIAGYFTSLTELQYIGDRYSIYVNSNDTPIYINKNQGQYIVPQIMYISAERNFLSTIKNAYDVKNLPEHLFDFGEVLKRAQREFIKVKIELPLRKYRYQYLESADMSLIYSDGHIVDLAEASSGLQSFVPAFLVSRNLANSIKDEEEESSKNFSVNLSFRRNQEIADLMLNKKLTQDQKDQKLAEITARYHNKCFINIVEEPEQNLFPTSQRHILNSLLEFCNMTEGNKLIMTTHSPYILSYLSLAVQGNTVMGKINDAGKQNEMTERLEKVVPVKSLIAGSDLAVYQLNEDGSISLLPDYEGIPSDKNYLNRSLMESNQLFDALLDIEDDL